MSDSPLPESLSTFHAVVLAHARAGLRSGCAQDPRLSASASAAPDSTSAETRVRPARLVPPRRSNTHKGHLAPIQIP
jgi:hypothetical protein